MTDSKHPLERLSTLVAAGMLIAAIFFLFLTSRGSSVWPHNSFLFDPHVRFSDFLSNYSNWRQHNGLDSVDYVLRESGPSLQPGWDATSFLLSRIPSADLALFVHNCLCLITLTIIVHKGIRKFCPSQFFSWWTVVLLVGSAYPTIFVLDRANLEWLSVVFLGLHLIENRRYRAAIFLGLSFSVKPWTAVLLVRYFLERRFREIAVALATYVGMVAAITYFLRFYYGLPMRFEPLASLSNYRAYQSDMVTDSRGIAFGHSLYGAAWVFLKSTMKIVPDWFEPGYLIVALITFFICSYMCAFRKLSVLQTSLVLLILVDLLPWVSADYKLLNLLVVGTFVVAADAKSPEVMRLVYFLAFCLIPKGYFLIANLDQSIPPSVNVAVIATPLALCCLLLRMFRQPKDLKNLTA